MNMKRHDIEQQIYEEFNEQKPDLFQNILEHCPKMTEEPETISFWDKLKALISVKRFTYSLASVTLVLIFALIVFGGGDGPSSDPYSVIALDVNPSVVLELNEDDEVINVIKNNSDAEIIVGDMDLINVDYNVAINALIGSMVANGYINELTNSVLLSIQSNDLEHEDALLADLTERVSQLLSGSSIAGSVITQRLQFSADAESLAETLDISEAKAELILDIIDIDPRTEPEALAKLSINDLNLLLEAKNYALDDVKHVGKPSILSIITEQDAYQIALAELELESSNVIEYEIELEQEAGIMVYEVEIDTETAEYELLIHAKEGTVLTEDDLPDDDQSDDGDDTDDNDGNDNTDSDLLSETAIMTIIINQLELDELLITELEIEQEEENNIIFYDIQFEYGDDEYELEVDALTGVIYSNSMDETGYDYEADSDEDEEESDD